jgi:DNA mismatch repair protein MutS2
LEYEEKKEEINRILKQLSNSIRPPLLIISFLSDIDVVAAKAKYAIINGILPTLGRSSYVF